MTGAFPLIKRLLTIHLSFLLLPLLLFLLLFSFWIRSNGENWAKKEAELHATLRAYVLEHFFAKQQELLANLGPIPDPNLLQKLAHCLSPQSTLTISQGEAPAVPVILDGDSLRLYHLANGPLLIWKMPRSLLLERVSLDPPLPQDAQLFFLENPPEDEEGAFSRVKGSNFALFVPFAASLPLRQLGSHFLSMLWVLLGTTLLITAIIVFFSYRISRPLQQLFVIMQQVGQGNMHARFQGDPFGFEINEVGYTFNRMVDQLLDQIEFAKKERLNKEALLQEFKIAKYIQTSILPEIPSVAGLDLAAAAQPARQVGGDFYDLFLKPSHEGASEQLVLTIGDTAGKGVSACLYAACLRSMLRSYQVERTQLSQQIALANDLFFTDAEHESMFVTVFTGLYTPSTGQLRYSSAGHQPALLLRQSKELLSLGTPGIALGVAQEIRINEAEITLQKGDLLLLYTDGVIDALNQSGERFGEERLNAFIQAHGELSSQLFVDKLLTTLQAFSDNTAQFDDITLLVLRVLN